VWFGEKRAGEGGGNPTLSRRRVHMVTESLNWTIDLPLIIIMLLRAKGLYLLYFSEVFEFNSINL
jgi:hypothetical protein